MNKKQLQQNLIQVVLTVAVLIGMISFGVWYFRLSTGGAPITGLSQSLSSAIFNSQPVAGNNSQPIIARDGKLQSNACGVTARVPKSWRESGRSVPFAGTPLDAAVMDEPYRQTRRTVFWFACFDAQKYELVDLIGKDIGTAALEAAQEENVGGVTFRRTRDFWYATQNGKHLLLNVNFAQYDSQPEAGYEDTMMNIVRSISFAP